MAHEIRITDDISHFEISVIGRQPLIHDAGDLDPPLAKHDRTRRLLAAMACLEALTDSILSI